MRGNRVSEGGREGEGGREERGTGREGGREERRIEVHMYVEREGGSERR